VKRDLGVVILQGDEYKKMLCPSCKGTGRCPTCKGTGEMMCPECNGKGYYQLPWSSLLHSCGRCGGDGGSRSEEYFFEYVTRGGIKLGRGKVWCSNCMGTGVCPRCGGEGLIFEHE
jgi:RecJ-like exonuclease